ncbi:MAG: nucleotide sugar dehydrogenase [Candidatus Omnitrophota bacterium]|nr:nucleotide sugar dehydrogenase [Candidatus Omnitrophota bacterium]
MVTQLETKILNKKARLAVVGLGYVGLPLAVHFAKAGFRVLGLDTDQDRVSRIKQGSSYIVDIPSSDIAKILRSGRLQASTDFSLLKSVDVVIICVPTPLKRKYTPDISFMLRAIRSIRRYIPKGALVILESTTYPGTTEELIKPELEKDKKREGKDFFLAFSPERIDPGSKKFPLNKIPKLVGGISPQSGQLAALLYRKIVPQVHLLSSAKAAEMTKLLENSFRIINIGWINEMAMICHHMGIDVWEVIEAAKTKPFGFMPFYPGLGVGGHCIPDDPLYLHWKAKRYGYNPRFIKLAADINAGMPHYAAQRLIRYLKHKPLPKVKILIVGVTYKKDVKDLRKSPPLKFIEALRKYRCQVDYTDPYIPYLEWEDIHSASVKLDKKSIGAYDCVVIATDHSNINYKLILDNAKFIFDIRNVYAGASSKKVVRF